ncbi:MAG: Asp23/Gls24 family envelope stress response protein, partial [Herbiconiux sp.]|nr:Asp23/Gls24 family envelope stress response protein [Herbiconiux sp.]
MSNPTTGTATAASSAAPASGATATPTPSAKAAPAASASAPAVSASRGTTTIADGVVEKVAGIAARQVRGVHDLGGGAARAIGAIRNAINAKDRGQGVSVEVGERQVAADIVVVAEYPVDLQSLADDIRSNVIEAVTTVVGLEVTEVNVTVADVHLPADDADDEAEPRV